MKTSLRLLALVPLALLVSLEAVAASPLNGTWSGSGVVVPEDGQKEKVLCRISYSQQSSTIYGVDVKCTSTSSKQIRQAGQLRQISATQLLDASVVQNTRSLVRSLSPSRAQCKR